MSPIATSTYVATDGAIVIKNGKAFTYLWGSKLALTALIASMAVNALVTGLIVFKILKVFLEVTKVTSSIYRTRSYMKWRYGGVRHGAIGGNSRDIAFGVLALG